MIFAHIKVINFGLCFLLYAKEHRVVLIEMVCFTFLIIIIDYDFTGNWYKITSVLFRLKSNW